MVQLFSFNCLTADLVTIFLIGLPGILTRLGPLRTVACNIIKVFPGFNMLVFCIKSSLMEKSLHFLLIDSFGQFWMGSLFESIQQCCFPSRIRSQPYFVLLYTLMIFLMILSVIFLLLGLSFPHIFKSQKKREKVISLAPLHHFHPLHIQLDINGAITAKNSSVQSQQLVLKLEPLVSECKSLTTDLCTLQLCYVA